MKDYIEKMRSLGFYKQSVMVHRDDAHKIKQIAKKYRKERLQRKNVDTLTRDMIEEIEDG